MQTEPSGRVRKASAAIATDPAPPASTGSWFARWASVAAESVLRRVFHPMAPALERFGMIHPTVHPEDEFALREQEPGAGDFADAMLQRDLGQRRDPEDERSLVEPTDLDHVPELEFVVDEPFYIAKGIVTTLYGLGGVGKTSFAAALAASIALGRPFLGASLREGRVFYGEFEGAGQLLARTTKKVAAALEQDVPGAAQALKANFVQRHYTAKEKADWRYARGMIPALIRQLGDDYDVVILDSYEGATMGDSNDAHDAAEMMQLFAQLASETNTAVILIDHAPKHNPTSVFGSTKKTDFARVVIHIAAQDGSDGHRLTLKSAKCNVAPEPSFPRIKRQETEGTLRFVQDTGFTVKIGEEHDSILRDRTQRQIKEATKHGASSRTEIYEHIRDEEGYTSIDGPRKRVHRLGLEPDLPARQHGKRREG